MYIPLLGSEPFVVLPFRALGGIDTASVELLRRLVGKTEDPDFSHCLAGLSVQLAVGVGRSLVEARRPTQRT